MNSSRLLLVVLAALGLLIGASLFLWSGHEDSAAAELVAASPTSPALAPETVTPLAPAEVSTTVSPGAARSGERTAATVTTDRIRVAARTLTVRLDLPSASPTDEELSVLAVPAALLEDLSAGEVLNGLRDGSLDTEDTVRVAVEGQSLELPLPVGMDEPRLLVDGHFLYLAEPVPVAADENDVTLAPELGAALVVRLELPADAEPTGKLSIFGGDFGGRRSGFGRQEREVAGTDELVFRALDTELMWSVSPSLEELHGYTETGLELEAGEERVLALVLTRGVAVAGEVVDEGGRPLAGVEVRAGRRSWFGDGRRETSTDAEGRFELLALPPGEFRVEAEQDGWISAESDTFERADGERVDGVRLTLRSGLAIAGTVRAEGREAAGTLVVVEQKSSGGGFGNWGGRSRIQRVGEATVEDDGSFRVTGLEEGQFTVRAALELGEEEGDSTWRALAEAVPSGTEGLRLELAGPLPFEGRVVDDRGEPVPSFELVVESVRDGGPRERRDFEDENGAFVFARVGPGEWEVEARAEGHENSEPLVVSLPAAGEPLELRVGRQSVVAGRVFGSTGAPAAGATVSADDGRGGNQWGGRSGASVETDAEGRFELDGLAAGGIVLTAAAEGWADSEGLALDLSPGERREDAELVLRTGGTIVGTVVTSEGDPQPGRRVTWGAGAGPWGARGEATTDAAGHFELEHVTPGDWSVAAGPSMAEMTRGMRGNNGQTAFVEAMSDLDVETVTVIDGEVTEIFLGGEPKRPVRIYGVVSRNGQPFPDAQVYAVSEGSAVFEGMKAAVSAEDGSYELTVDRPGPYALSVSAGRVGAEVLVDVPREDETRVDLPIPLGRIEGTVRAPGGERAEGVSLAIQREDGLGRMRWNGSQATTDANGDYAFEDLEEGRYTVRASTAGWGGGRSVGETWGSSVVDGIAVGKDLTTSDIDFELETAGSVEGIVRDPDGDPLSGLTVFFRDAAGRLVTSVSGTRTDAAGHFEETGLAPGRYTISARGEGFAANEAASVDVRSSETAEVEIEVEVGTTLLVTLEDEGGEARRSRVEVFDRDDVEVGGMVTVEALQAAFSEGASTRERRLGPLPPGRYTVRATLMDGTSEERRVTLRGRETEKKVKLKLED